MSPRPCLECRLREATPRTPWCAECLAASDARWAAMQGANPPRTRTRDDDWAEADEQAHQRAHGPDMDPSLYRPSEE